MRKVLVLCLAICFVFALTALAFDDMGKSTTVNGWITDAKCGAKGANAGGEACTKKCVAAGEKMVIAYNQVFAPARMLTVLLILSLIKSAMIIGYFMHLKFESSRMKWLLMTSVCFCLVLMAVFFNDAIRIVSRYFY